MALSEDQIHFLNQNRGTESLAPEYTSSPCILQRGSYFSRDFSEGDVCPNDGDKLYSKQTWESTIDFLEMLSKVANEVYRFTVTMPKIMEGINGSIDIRWKGEGYRLLINFKPNKKIVYYGYNSGKGRVRGILDLNDAEWVDNIKIGAILFILKNDYNQKELIELRESLNGLDYQRLCDKFAFYAQKAWDYIPIDEHCIIRERLFPEEESGLIIDLPTTVNDTPKPDKKCNCGECACKDKRNNIVEAESKPLIIEEATTLDENGAVIHMTGEKYLKLNPVIENGVKHEQFNGDLVDFYNISRFEKNPVETVNTEY